MRMLQLDDVNLAILVYVADHPNSSVTDGAKALYSPESTYDLQKRDAMLRHRYKGLAEAKLLRVRVGSRRSLYSIDTNQVFFGFGLQSIELGGTRQRGLGLDNEFCIAIRTGSGLRVQSLDSLERRWANLTEK